MAHLKKSLNTDTACLNNKANGGNDLIRIIFEKEAKGISAIYVRMYDNFASVKHISEEEYDYMMKNAPLGSVLHDINPKIVKSIFCKNNNKNQNMNKITLKSTPNTTRRSRKYPNGIGAGSFIKYTDILDDKRLVVIAQTGSGVFQLIELGPKKANRLEKSIQISMFGGSSHFDLSDEAIDALLGSYIKDVEFINVEIKEI